MLLSDPSVARMTATQWVFEFQALRRREVDMEKRVTAMLGLNMLDTDRPVPLAMLCGSPELLKHVGEELNKMREAEAGTADMDFDAFSDALMHATAPKGDTSAEVPADMQPILQPIPKFDYTTTEEYAREFAALIKPRHK